MLTSTVFKTPISLIRKEILPNIWVRTCTTESPALNEEPNQGEVPHIKDKKKQPLSLCLKYMESKAYKTTYGDKPVWHIYVRNFKGGIPPDTRHSCMTPKGILTTGSPCPICRDEYLLPHYQNVKLIEQFISPYGGNILHTKKTGVCQKQQLNLKVAIKKAMNYGLLTFPVPHRHYDYSLYNKK